MKSNCVANQHVTIEFIDSQTNNTTSQLPLVIVPGLSESAHDYIPLMELLSCRCIAISLRGRGQSDAPATGYTLEDHIRDIDAVIKHLELDQFILMGFSRGVSYAIGYIFTNLDSVKGLIIGDYPAMHTKLPLEWVEYFSSLPPWRNKSLSVRMPSHAVSGIQKESDEVFFWDKLNFIQCPTLIIKGGKQGSALSVENLAHYGKRIPQAELVVFEESSHNIFEPQLDKFVKEADGFMKKL